MHYTGARMDPLTIGLIAAVVAAVGGGAATVIRARRSSQREAMRAAVRAPVPCGAHAPVSLFDVFWDLGASEYALAMMAHRGILIDDPAVHGPAMAALGEQIVDSGGRAAYVAEQLEAIEEYYRDHNAAGDRRKMLALAAPTAKMLPAAGTGALAVSYAAQIHGGVDDRQGWRADRPPEALSHGTTEDAAATEDLDTLIATDVQSLLRAIFSNGSVWGEAKKWFALREARRLKERLDRALGDLHGLYVAHVRADVASRTNLEDAARRWEAEATRTAAVCQQVQRGKEPWRLCAEVLAEEAVTLARALAEHSRANVTETLARIDALADEGEHAMAGYLVYVNRYAFFVGKQAVCESAVRAIDSALGELRVELRRLRREGSL